MRVRGAVQGVGFRPFVYRLAAELGLCGAVWNEPDGVVIDVEGDAVCVASLLRGVEHAHPERAGIVGVEVVAAPLAHVAGFEIRPSADAREREAECVADLATCAQCLAEIRDPADRRFGYPFANCTQCGPRYSIVEALPYDRARTTMSAFAMCDACADEYADPASRRFHAQPNACPACGPRLWLERPGGRTLTARDALDGAASALARGGIVAIRGLGGFHLACDAGDGAAVGRLRARKRRPAKPFAVMFADLGALQREAEVDAESARRLTSARAPIALVPLREPTRLARAVAPGLREVGALLPYTPLHHALLAAVGRPLVMTSGNRSGSPIAATRREARAQLAGVADAWLMHDREIRARVEDSVVRAEPGRAQVLRRARGFAPGALALPLDAPPLLAVGADLKNAFCLAEGRRAVLAPHLGDLAGFDNQQLFARTRERLEALLRIRPALVVHDLHPDYHATRLAHAAGLPRVAVQHHHAHVAACLAEHGRTGPAIGVAWDGSGFGSDGSVWGGEFLHADLRGFRRLGRLRPVPLPGGDAAVRAPWRMAVSHLLEAGLAAERIDAPERGAVEALVRRRWNAPPTSSAGRLFDAVAALTGVCERASYEGQAAMELEAASAPGAAPYPLAVATTPRDGGRFELDARPLVRAIARDLDAGAPVAEIGGRFHAALADGIARGCALARETSGLEVVALSGGCFHNRLLARGARERLERAGFEVLEHAEVPAGDGGIAFGQAAVAAARAAEP